ncbi:MAG TPA: amino acid permease [Candidatus Krumholzibacteria bacterium]|nr:amino acid permease [Candidatus Krumholzibacteria bacterium]
MPPQNPQRDDGLRRVLGPVSATCIVIGAIVGVGIFFTPTSVARIAGSGPLALWTWIAGGVVALLGALTFAELGGMYGRTGGQYAILRDAYGPAVAFCFVFCNSTAILAGGIAIIALVCAENLAAFVAGSVPAPGTVGLIAAALIALLAAANGVGVRWGAAIQNVTVFAKVSVLLLIAALAAFATHHAAAAEPVAAGAREHSWIALLFAGLVPALFAYGGWQHVLWIGGEVKDPRRNLPLATVLGVSIVVVVYVAVNWGYLRLLGHGGVSGSHALASDAVSVVWPRAGGRFVAGAVALSAFGVLNEQILSGPRLLFGMARDGRFFAPFARVAPRFATPAPAIALIAALAATLVFAAGKNGIDRLLTGVVLVDAVFFGLTGAALIVLRVRHPDADRPARVPLYPVVPALFVLFEAAIVVGAFQIEANRAAAWIGLIWVALALAGYALFFRNAATRGAAPGR